MSSSAENVSKRARIVIIEDHPVVRHGLAGLIEDEPDFHVVGLAATADEALAKVDQLKPDIAIVDIALGESSGLDLITRLHAAAPTLYLLALSMHDESLYAERALQAGAHGYIMKKEAMDKVMTAIRRVLSGEVYISERMASRMVNKLLDRAGPKSSLETLSPREFEVFQMIANSVGPTEIANRLRLSVKTVETHREKIKQKLGLKTGADLTRYAVKWALETAGTPS